ncbi:hypothetical protein I308_106680 [Cryptococcus tetragattii IND107]|uniref:Uncharacterized protein n=1 Tax=Cryptococcus tetragattii IND107 TaxID=1296105 RepID=A0ABR3BIA4_9TREE
MQYSDGSLPYFELAKTFNQASPSRNISRQSFTDIWAKQINRLTNGPSPAWLCFISSVTTETFTPEPWPNHTRLLYRPPPTHTVGHNLVVSVIIKVPRREMSCSANIKRTSPISTGNKDNSILNKRRSPPSMPDWKKPNRSSTRISSPLLREGRGWNILISGVWMIAIGVLLVIIIGGIVASAIKASHA